MALRKATFEGVDAALSTSGITLSQAHVDAFVREFIDGLETQIKTPRQVKLYVNALTFALPLLKGEVHPVDLMLIEGIRVFYPKLYRAIRDNPEYFLKEPRDDHGQREVHREKVARLIDDALEGVGVQNKESVRNNLIEVLFPRLGNRGYGSEWDKEWAREQRIRSDQYFKRFFTYSIPVGDVSDIDVGKFLEQVATIGGEDANAHIKALSERGAVPKFIRKLRERENEIEKAAAQQLALAIARNGALIPRERAMLASDWTFMQAGILVARLLKRLPIGQERDAFAQGIIQIASPLPFAFECLKWLRHSEDQSETDRIITAEAEVRLGVALANRISAQAAEFPLYLAFGDDAPRLHWLWNKHSSDQTVQHHLRSRFEAIPSEIDGFLETFVGHSWGAESGLPRRGDFGRDAYNAVAALIEPGFIVGIFRDRYGEELDAPEFHQNDDVPLPLRLARQFTFIHLHVETEKAQVIDRPDVPS